MYAQFLGFSPVVMFLLGTTILYGFRKNGRQCSVALYTTDDPVYHVMITMKNPTITRVVATVTSMTFVFTVKVDW